MPVSERFKKQIGKRVDTWKQKMLTKYSPKGIFSDVNLASFTIVRQHVHMTSIAPPKASLVAHLVTKDSENIQLVILEYPTVWDADNMTEMLDHNLEIAVFDRQGLCSIIAIPHFIFLGCFGDNATQVRTARGHQYYIDRYDSITKEHASKLDVLDKWPEVVVRDENEIYWAADSFGDYHLNIKNMEGDVVIYAKKIPLWKRVLRPDNIGPRLKLDVSVKEDIPKEIVLFLASRSV